MTIGTNMELCKAIKALIAQEGINILANSLLVNYLADLQAFELMPSSKYIIKMMYNEGTMNKLIDLHIANGVSENCLRKIANEIENKWGFKKNPVVYTLENIASALDYKYTIVETSQKDMPLFPKTQGKHLCFRNVEICGELDNVIAQLENLGYKTVDLGQEGALLSGTFAGEQNCQILVSFSEFINEVESITVMLPEVFTWWSLKANYDKFKEKLTSKYGRAESIEQFYDPYYEGDGDELLALDCQKAIFTSRFNVDKGYIRISIAPKRVFISYIDTLNELRIEEIKNSLADLDL